MKGRLGTDDLRKPCWWNPPPRFDWLSTRSIIHHQQSDLVLVEADKIRSDGGFYFVVILLLLLLIILQGRITIRPWISAMAFFCGPQAWGSILDITKSTSESDVIFLFIFSTSLSSKPCEEIVNFGDRGKGEGGPTATQLWENFWCSSSSSTINSTENRKAK